MGALQPWHIFALSMILLVVIVAVVALVLVRGRRR